MKSGVDEKVAQTIESSGPLGKKSEMNMPGGAIEPACTRSSLGGRRLVPAAPGDAEIMRPSASIEPRHH